MSILFRCLFTTLLILFSFCGESSWGQSVADYLQQASQLVESYRFREAMELLSGGLQRHPDDPQLLLQLGSLLIRTGNVEQGERYLERALGRQPHHPRLWKERAEAELRKGDLGKAITLLRRSLFYDSRDADSQARMAYTLFLGGQLPESLEHARRAVDLAPLNARYRQLYAQLLESAGRREEAVRQLRLAQGLAPQDARILFQLAEKRRLDNHWGQALEYLEMASELDPENPLYHAQMARLYRQLGESRLARQAQEKADQLLQAFEVYLRALSLSLKGEVQEAIQLLQPVVDRHASFVTGRLLLADLYRRLGRSEEAARLYLQVLERDPDNPVARQQGIWTELETGSLQRALELAGSYQEKLIEEILLGYQKMLQEEWDSALLHLSRAQRLQPLNTELLELISYCQRRAGHYDEALETLGQVQNLAAKKPGLREEIRDILFDKGLDLFRQERWEQALAVFEKVLSGGSARAEWLFYAAYSRQKLGRLEEAIRDYRAGLRLDPQAHWARQNLASSLYLLGRHEEALREWERVAALRPSGEVHLQLGLCYAHLERYPEAERSFRTAYQLGVRTAQLLYNLGITLQHLHQSEEAWQLIRRSADEGYLPAQRLLQRAFGERP